MVAVVVGSRWLRLSSVAFVVGCCRWLWLIVVVGWCSWLVQLVVVVVVVVVVIVSVVVVVVVDE